MSVASTALSEGSTALKIFSWATIILFLPQLALADKAPAQAAQCVACHGKTGISGNAEWPNLAGQKPGYIAAQLQAFLDGRRSNPQMAPALAGLKEADVEILAQWYAAQAPAASANGDPALVGTGHNLSGYCKACHGMTGKTINDEWPNLAGQQAGYLQKQLLDFKRGERISPQMQAVLSSLDEQGFAALAAYYSQLQP